MDTPQDRFAGPLAATLPLPPPGAERAAALDALLLPPDAALPVPPATERGRWDPARGALDAATATAVVDRAEADLGTPWPLPLASTAARLHRDGDRDTHEQLVHGRERRLSRAAVAAAVSLGAPGADRWLDEVADGVWQLCEQSSWCWPAHDDSRLRHGSVLPTVTDPYLDLGAGEVVGQLAWVDHLLGAGLDARYPGLRARVRHEARARVVEPFLRRRDWHWLGRDGDVHNWNPWIHGNVLVAALRLLDGEHEAAERARVVELVLQGLDRYVGCLPDDGAIDEGYAYWWNGACRALEALDVLAHATGGAVDALDPGRSPAALRGTVAFPHRMHLGGAWYLNLADGQARPHLTPPWRALHRAALRTGDPDAAAHALAHRVAGAGAEEQQGLGRLLRALTDRDWQATSDALPPLPAETWLGSTEVLVARERTGDAAGLALAVKGGHNAEAHNHNDVGSVVVASDGVPVVVDAGRPTYTAQTFGPDRYRIWTMQSSWHSVPEVAGTAQAVGAGARARHVRPALRGDDAGVPSGVTLDLAAAYPVAGLRSWRRSARLERGPDARVVVSDAWDLDDRRDDGRDDPAATTVRFLLAGDVSLTPGSAVVVPLDGAPPLRLTWPPDVPAALVDRPLDDRVLSEVWGDRLARLDLTVTARADLQVAIARDVDAEGAGRPGGGPSPAAARRKSDP
ncbi:heparinase II/III family protein [Isoptericola sp. NPDC056134]|uniref:heparinase II/III domain-containing protein n=1 Tax=Isoptericola sp. NPDC056134 TaxID=3345723 RepID=UPI0035E65D14